MEHILSVLPRSGFALNAEFLKRLKGVVQADINLYTIKGVLMATTIDDDQQRELLPLIDPKPVLNELTAHENKTILTNRVNKGEPLRLAYYLVTPSQGTQPVILTMMISTKDIAMAKRRSALFVGIVGFIGIVAMVFLGNRVAKGITTPLKGLVATMEGVAEGGLLRKTRIESEDEIGKLAHSFNSMIERLRDSEEKLIKSEKLSVTGKLAAGIAHELRNPLSSIKMLVQMFRTKLSDKSSERSLDVILSEIEKVESVVKELLDLSKPGEIELKKENIQGALKDAIRLSEGQFKHRKIKLKKMFDAQLPDIQMDRDRLKQAFLNLLLNASEAMPTGGEISIRSYVKNGSLKVEIQDNGSGIPPGLAEKVFEPFFTTKKDGIGLGLSNTKRIIEQHGGNIQLKAHKYGGTISEIVIPLE